MFKVVLLAFLLYEASSTTDGVEEESLGRVVLLSVIEEMLTGPLEGRSLVLYLDPSLDLEFKNDVMNIFENSYTPLVIVDLGTNGSWWSRNQPLGLLRSTSNIHFVLFKTDPTPFFKSVSLHWHPRYVLFYSLVSEPDWLLHDEAFRGIERIAYMSPTVSSVNSSDFSMRIHTSFPFSLKDSTVLLGVWNAEAFDVLEEIFVDRYQTFEGYEFHLSTWFDDFPYLYQSKTAEEGVGDGVEVEMLDAMAKTFNYSYTLTTQPPDKKWGAFVNGTWTGMLGMLYRKEKNFTVNYFAINRERVQAFDPTVSYWMEGFGMSMMSPPPLARWRGTYYPFKPNVWIGIGVTYVLIVVLMTIQDRLQEKPFLRGLGETWSYLLQALVNQGATKLPEAQWQRLFMGWWLLYSFIVTIAYTANLIAFLTIPVFPARIQTVQQLADSSYGYRISDSSRSL